MQDLWGGGRGEGDPAKGGRAAGVRGEGDNTGPGTGGLTAGFKGIPNPKAISLVHLPQKSRL